MLACLTRFPSPISFLIKYESKASPVINLHYPQAPQAERSQKPQFKMRRRHIHVFFLLPPSPVASPAYTAFFVSPKRRAKKYNDKQKISVDDPWERTSSPEACCYCRTRRERSEQDKIRRHAGVACAIAASGKGRDQGTKFPVP